MNQDWTNKYTRPLPNLKNQDGMNPLTTGLLFAYGTLMKPWSHGAARFLHENSEYLGTASLAGRLYDLGDYPGLVYDTDSPVQVKGQLFRLNDPARILLFLDDYEGASEESPESGLFRKELLPVLFEGSKRSAWVYTYNQPLNGALPIPSGDYLSYAPDQGRFKRSKS